MDYRDIAVDALRKDRTKSLLNGASSSKAKLIQKSNEKQLSAPTRLSETGDVYDLQPQSWENPQEEEAYYRSEASLEYSLNLIERRLEERQVIQGEVEGTNSSICVFRFPHSLVSINNKA